MTYRILLLGILWILGQSGAFQIHKHMTVDEIRDTFHVERHDLVPDYELVPIYHHVRKRSIDTASGGTNSIPEVKTYPTKGPPIRQNPKLRLKAFGEPFNLSLVPNEGLFNREKIKIITVEPNATSQHGVEYVEHPQDGEEIGELYQDEENQAAILLRKEGGDIVVEGSIGAHLAIRPVPSRLRPAVKAQNPDDEVFLDDDGEMSSEVAIDTGLPIIRDDSNQTETTTHHHIVIKRKKNNGDTMSDYALMEPDHLSKRFKRSTRSKRDAPYTIYPEILVIVDYDGYRMHGGDNLQIKRYFISFWNGVDLRYKLLKGPKIRVSIAGIIISRGRDATPYLERNRVGRDAIDSAAALTDMGKYLFRERRLPVYDIAVAITKYDMCRRRKGGRCTKGTAGFAYVGGACVVNKRLEKVNSVAIIEDTGGFSGIIVAAHEVGHLLGAVHDGSPPPSYLGGPGAEKCQWTDGFIMSDLRHTERGFRWSPCSVSSFHHFLNGDTATCLYNAPHEDESLPRVLPGKLLSLDAQCKRDRGTSACFKDDRVCAQLFCFDAGSGYCVAYRPAAEGSACGDGQYCLNGHCVAEHENIIPDYSQNQPAYVRPNSFTGRPLFNSDEQDEFEPLPPDTYKSKAIPYKPNNYYPSQTSTTPSTTTIKILPPETISTTGRPWGWFLASPQYPSTRNPYDVGSFGQSSKDQVKNNYLKRSYNAASFYGDSSDMKNSTVGSTIFSRTGFKIVNNIRTQG
ncbi:A disintegrin and metalloproteinase with thrombospondin motifs 1 isoform X2 [Sitophilus oryzae]|uniref:A disintegrin and metalloproteinase with thrombospondin motifs 1 isoform X2 n=1 Tax=Sitophilus oryzae TaxID=7048 RepID=A0A6J2Y219_SITOR|nr:A disintegrin and metalloproteinase with thrombospondin motifs 1 isoform X2 [Sitophilus oryzae]